MFLSKIKLAPRWANNPYQWHRALWQLFAGREDAERDFLFRVEKGALGETYVLLQSAEEPAATVGDVQVLASKPFKPALAVGQALRFHLVANPIKTIRDAHGRLDKRGEPKACRVPLIRAEEQQDWLRRKLSGAADLEQLQAMVRPPLYFRRKGAAGKVVPVAFDGVLTVRDPDQLHALLQNGIGPAKSFGCGLLSLARA
mgnify:CR=1 FL=1